MNSLTAQIQTAKIVTELKRAGVYKPEFNIVGLEGLGFNKGQFYSNDDQPDRWNDSIIVIQQVKGKDEIIDAYSCSTEPGAYYTLNPMNAAGAARLAFGSYRDSHTFGIHGSLAKHYALVQCGDLTVCRDLNKDFSRVGDRMYTGDGYAINIHAAVGSPGLEDSIGRYSAGCQVIRLYEQQKIFMQLAEDSGLSKFSYSLFDGKAVTPGSTLPLLPAVGSKPQ
jgi:hypothetical protein